MKSRRLSWAWILVPAALLPAAAAGQDKPGKDPTRIGTITVAMEDCKASRPGRISKGTTLFSLLFSGGPKDQNLAKKGSVPVDGRTYWLYLPKASSYTVKNTGARDDQLENTSTLISIDFNGDGKLEDSEGWYANMPIRLGDQMFEVKEISKTGDRIVLAPSSAPLRGVIEGFRCPPFELSTDKGEHVTRDQLAGKAFLLDVWSVT